MLSLIALVAAVVTGLSACNSGGGIEPPAGWEDIGEGRWIRTGADTTGAFRDLSSVAAIGIVDSTDSEVIRYAKEALLYLYRTSPEIVDSLFQAEAVPLLSRSFPRENFQAEVDGALNDVKKALLGDGTDVSTYRQSTALPGSSTAPAVYPDSLKNAGVTGRVAVQTFVTADKQPVAVQVVESVNPTLDALVMRQAATATYTSAWVIEDPRRGGKAIPNYVRLTIPYE